MESGVSRSETGSKPQGRRRDPRRRLATGGVQLVFTADGAALAAALVLAGVFCGAAPAAHAAPPQTALAGTGLKAAPAAPKLVVLLVADQFRADNLTRLGPSLDPGGLRRLLQKGASAIGHYGQQNTYTGPGHALIATGSYGYLNGITQNKFWNQRSGRSESMLYDESIKILGNKKQSADDDNSPRNLIGSTVFDELRLLRRDSKVVAVALKGRGAILLAGHLGQAYFFSEQLGEMTSSSFYMGKVPEWVQRWNGQKFVDKAFGTRWERLLPADKFQRLQQISWQAQASPTAARPMATFCRMVRCTLPIWSERGTATTIVQSSPALSRCAVALMCTRPSSPSNE